MEATHGRNCGSKLSLITPKDPVIRRRYPIRGGKYDEVDAVKLVTKNVVECSRLFLVSSTSPCSSPFFPLVRREMMVFSSIPSVSVITVELR